MRITNETSLNGKEGECCRVLYCHIDRPGTGRTKSAEYIRNYCTEKQVFPLIEIYQKQEQFFARTLKTVPTVVFLALPGVSGLNAAEQLRSLYPKCGIIWCSDLDFSLHAFRLRIEYFFMKPVEEQKIKEGLSIWFECKKGGGYERKESN